MGQLKFWLRHDLGMLLIVILMFVAPLVYLFISSRQMVKQEAMNRAESVLSNTALRVSVYLTEVETATRNMEWLVVSHMQPDSLLSYTHRIVALNPNVNGCSITAEPDYFPRFGRYFSAYSVRENDSITTVREAEYDYYSKEWYKSCKEARAAVWVDPYDDFNEGTLYASEMISSYSLPLFKGDSTFVGIISTDISLPKFSEVIAAATPYEGSYCIMIGKHGNFLVHPDKDRLLFHTILDGVNSRLQPDVVTLSNRMMKGEKGSMSVEFEGRDCLVFFRPVADTGWSLALVCPEESILGSYNRLARYFIPFLIVGLFILLFYSRKVFDGIINSIIDQK